MLIELPFRDIPGFGRQDAIGVLPSGKVVWPIMGGAPKDDEDSDDPKDGDDPDDDPDDDPEDDPDDDPKDPPKKGAKKKDDPDDDDSDDDDDKSHARKWEGRAKANKREADTAKAALAAIKKALGGKDDGDDPKEIKADLEKIRQQANESRVENAVLRTAGKLGFNGDKLADSRGFMARAGKLDPDDDDFSSKLRRAMREFTKENEGYEAGEPKKTATRSGSAVSGKGSVAQLGEDDLKKMSAAEIVKAQSEGRLDEYMGIKK